MKHEAKVYLSQEETDLVLNKEWLFLKRSIIDKIFTFFGGLHEAYRAYARQYGAALSFLPVDRRGKIARGENLNGLPYVMMDYPALFSKEKIVAVRTLFWWGNYFSISLHISGFAISDVQLSQWLDHFRDRNFYISINQDEWNYEFHDENFAPFTAENEKYMMAIRKHNIFRVATRHDIHADLARAELLQSFREIIDFLAVNFPAGEKDLLPGSPKANSHP